MIGEVMYSRPKIGNSKINTTEWLQEIYDLANEDAGVNKMIHFVEGKLKLLGISPDTRYFDLQYDGDSYVESQYVVTSFISAPEKPYTLFLAPLNYENKEGSLQNGFSAVIQALFLAKQLNESREFKNVHIIFAYVNDVQYLADKLFQDIEHRIISGFINHMIVLGGFNGLGLATDHFMGSSSDATITQEIHFNEYPVPEYEGFTFPEVENAFTTHRCYDQEYNLNYLYSEFCHPEELNEKDREIEKDLNKTPDADNQLAFSGTDGFYRIAETIYRIAMRLSWENKEGTMDSDFKH